MKTMFDRKSFAASMKVKRAVSGFSVRQAAKEIKISSATISRMENNSIPDVYTYFKCCKWMGCSMETFFKTTHAN